MSPKRNNPRWDEDSGVVPPSAADPVLWRAASVLRSPSLVDCCVLCASSRLVLAVGQAVGVSRVDGSRFVISITGSECRCVITRADVEGHADARMCCRGGWEW